MFDLAGRSAGHAWCFGLSVFDEIIPKALKQTVESTVNSLSPDLADKRTKTLKTNLLWV